MPIANGNPVAVFDSGVGGISVLKKLCDFLPHEHFWYFGDSAHAPYGLKSEREVLDLSCRYIGGMVDAGAKAVVIACNTATSAAASELRRRYTDVPIIGMEPEIKTPALDGHRHILVMATPMTLHLDKFRQLFAQYCDKARFVLQPCPGLAAMIEQGHVSSPQLRQSLEGLLGDYMDGSIDAIVLGCTHYLHIKPMLRDLFGRDVRFYDGAAGAARALKRKLEECNLATSGSGEGEIVIGTSGDPVEFTRLSKFLFSL